MSKKVLFVATVVRAHIMVFHIPYLKMFKDMGYEVHVAAKNDFDIPAECIIPYCDQYYNVEFERSPLKMKNIKAYCQIKEIVNNEEYDIIHCHTPVGGAITRLAAKNIRKRGTKVLYTAHGFHFYKGAPLKNWLLYYPVEKICSNFTDILFTINKEDYTLAKNKFHAKEIYHIPGIGVDMTRFENVQVNRISKRAEIGVPTDAYLLLSVGEVNKNKNHQVIIQAMSKMNNPKIHYAIAGRGEETENLKKLSKELGLTKQVHFLGFRTDIPELNLSADAFCFPSRREGLGLAAIEAMACGLPVISSNIHGINDYSIDGVTGYKCSADDVNGFVNCIQKCISNQLDMSLVRIENPERARKYDLERVKGIMKGIYELL